MLENPNDVIEAVEPVEEGTHQFSRGMHALCGKEIVHGVKGTRRRDEVTCPDCLQVREQIELGYALFKMHPEPGDVVVIRLGPKDKLTQEIVNDSLVLTEAVRKTYPETTFMFLWDEQTLEEISDSDMKQFGWVRQDKKRSGKPFRFKSKLTGKIVS